MNIVRIYINLPAGLRFIAGEYCVHIFALMGYLCLDNVHLL